MEVLITQILVLVEMFLSQDRNGDLWLHLLQ